MNQLMKLFYCLFIILFVLSCSTDDGGSEMDNTNTTPEPTPQETFGNWSPDFTNQTSDFTQTRTGSQGTQQTRTINVTSSSNTTTSTEESINQDINDDGDLFEDIEVILTTYTGSENLGSHQITTYNVTEDNDMGFTVGNNFYPLDDGVLENYGYLEYENPCTEEYIRLRCNDSGLYNIDLYLISEGINYSVSDNYGLEFSGDGSLFYFELWMESYNSLSGGQYFDLKTRTNETFGTNFTFSDFFDYNVGEYENSQFEIWSEENFGCNGQYELGSNSFDDCQLFNLYNYVSTTSIYQTEGNPDSGEEYDIVWTDGSLDISVDSNSLYTIKLRGGIDGLNLPVTLFYKGYLGYTEYDYDSSSESSKSTLHRKKKNQLRH